ncbi:MAG: response regulator transcription factor [Verrucomicrobiaceae bacterium]|nr:response regulator transcription factor [Verrucomicrobiaceae bacterium]
MKKILIIEDQATMRRNLALMLQMEGFDTATAENGRAGIEKAREQQPDLVLCDVMMPELDGYAVLRALREDEAFANTPFIFLTARTDRTDVRTGMNFGADDYLAKPVVRDDLLAAVHARLARAEMLQQRFAESSGFNPDFSRPDLLQHAHGLTPRESEVLVWVAQGKSNADVAAILGMSDKTVKHHLGVCFQKMGVESRNAASLVALETLSGHRRL